LVGSAKNFCAIGDCGALDDRAEELCAVRELEGLETAAESVKEDETSGVDLGVVVSVVLVPVEK
jgi:hypothetical protein